MKTNEIPQKLVRPVHFVHRRLALRWAYGTTGKKNSTSSREYKCTNPLCKFKYHRDGVGCLNILLKYRGDFPFNEQMEMLPRNWGPWQPPQVQGIRFHFHLSNPISAEYGVFG